MKLAIQAAVVLTAMLASSAALAERSRELLAFRLGAEVAGPTALMGAVSVRPWRLLEIEGEVGVVDLGPAAALRTGLAYPLRGPKDSFQIDAVALGGLRAISMLAGGGCRPRVLEDGSTTSLCGLPVHSFALLASAGLGLDLTLWSEAEWSVSGGPALTCRIFGGLGTGLLRTKPITLPELGGSIGFAF